MVRNLKIEDLKGLERFRECQPTDLQFLVDQAVIRVLEPGTFLFKEAETPRYFYIILSGYLKTFKLGQFQETLIHVFGPGDSIGEAPLHKGTSYVAYAKSLVRCEVLALPIQKYQSLLRSSHSFALAALVRVAMNSDTFALRIAQIVDGEVEDRLKGLIRHYSSLYGQSNSDFEVQIPFSLMRTEFASAIHARPETVSRILSGWEKLGHFRICEDSMMINMEFLQIDLGHIA